MKQVTKISGQQRGKSGDAIRLLLSSPLKNPHGVLHREHFQLRIAST